MRYLYVHINNDFSGASYAMKAIIEAHGLKDFTLMTDFKSDGFLKKLNYNDRINVSYTFKGKGLSTIYQIFRYAIVSLFRLINSSILKKTDFFYINTIHPWTTALIGWILRKKVIYHIHEYYANPYFHVKFYIWIMSLTASELIFVSNFTREKYLSDYPNLKKIKFSVQFTPVQFKTVNFHDLNIEEKFRGPILLICSPRKYKGIDIFISLAKRIKNREFKLFINNYHNFNLPLPVNLEVLVKDKNIETALKKASLCLNLSQKPDWIETFGLTVWESLSQGTPVVVPDIGGPLEIIDDTCGISCDTRNIDNVILSINKILSDIDLYTKFSKSSIKRSLFLKNLNSISKLDSK